MEIKHAFLAPGQGVRTGAKLGRVEGLVWHWIGVCQANAYRVRGSFTGTNLGTQYISDYNTGDILQVMPEDEAANHVGANKYTDTKTALLGGKSPNRYLVGVECCIGDKVIPADWATPGKHMELGRPSDKQYRSMVEFSADFLTRHGLGVDRLFRHYDITGKLCHVWFVKDETRWIKFKADVAAQMKGEIDMTREETQAIVDAAVRAAAPKVYTALAEVPKWAQGLLQRAMDAGIIKGDGTGNLNLTDQDLKTLSMMDRAGLLKGSV